MKNLELREMGCKTINHMEWFHAALTVLTALLPDGVHVRCMCGGEGRRDGLDAKYQIYAITCTSCDVSVSSGSPHCTLHSDTAHAPVCGTRSGFSVLFQPRQGFSVL